MSILVTLDLSNSSPTSYEGLLSHEIFIHMSSFFTLENILSLIPLVGSPFLLNIKTKLSKVPSTVSYVTRGLGTC